jgi:hypothetical protein
VIKVHQVEVEGKEPSGAEEKKCFDEKEIKVNLIQVGSEEGPKSGKPTVGKRAGSVDDEVVILYTEDPEVDEDVGKWV